MKGHLFRAMFAGQNTGLPAIANDAKSLGVRIPFNEKDDKHRYDVEIDPNGNLSPNDGGMSVASKPQYLPSHRIPRRLKKQFPDACGNDEYFVWKIDRQDVASKIIIPNLRIRWDSDIQHGLVKPCSVVHIDEYVNALKQTHNYWKKCM